jgi:predicted HTH domain antitoxin
MVTLISFRLKQKTAISMASTKGQIAARVGEEMLAQIKEIEKETRADRSEVIRRLLDEGVKQYRLRKAIDMLRGERTTVSRAAEIAGIPIWNMLDVMHAKKIPIPYGAEDLRRSLKLVR